VGKRVGLAGPAPTENAGVCWSCAICPGAGLGRTVRRSDAWHRSGAGGRCRPHCGTPGRRPAACQLMQKEPTSPDLFEFTGSSSDSGRLNRLVTASWILLAAVRSGSNPATCTGSWTSIALEIPGCRRGVSVVRMYDPGLPEVAAIGALLQVFLQKKKNKRDPERDGACEAPEAS